LSNLLSLLLSWLQLCNEDYHWWWRSFLSSGSTALYVLLYSGVYFMRTVQPNLFATYLLYFGYMSIISLGVFLMTGCIGFAAALGFTRLIYGSIKVD
jgi:transmembrane 9 superfamily protein 2/4